MTSSIISKPSVRETSQEISLVMAEHAGDIADVTQKLGEVSERIGGLSLFLLALPGGLAQWVAVTKPFQQGQDEIKNPADDPSAIVLNEGETMTMKTIKPEQPIMRLHLRRALRSFAIIGDLQNNPLAGFLDLSPFARTSDNRQVRQGLALKRALRAAIEQLKRGGEDDKTAGRYFEARFISRLSEQQSSELAGVSARTASRQRDRWLDRLFSALIQTD